MMNKKLIAIFTALLLAVSLCACNNGEQDEETTDDNKIEIPSGEDTSAEGTTDAAGDDTTESQTQTSEDNFEELIDAVSILVPTGAANLRTSPSMSASAVALSLVNGTKLQRIAISNDGWSKVTYEGQVYYIKTSCIVSDTEMSGFVAAEGTVTVKGSFNIRIAPNTANDPIGTLVEGDSFEVLAVNEATGWYQIYLESDNYTGDAYVAIIPEYMEGDVTILDVEESETTAGETVDGETTSGEVTEGETTAGEVTEGETTVGEATEGEATTEAATTVAA